MGEHIPGESLRRRVEQPRFRRGERVEYNSLTHGGWQACIVSRVHPDGRLMLQCERSGTTVKDYANLDRCRASTVTVAPTAAYVLFHIAPSLSDRTVIATYVTIVCCCTPQTSPPEDSRKDERRDSTPVRKAVCTPLPLNSFYRLIIMTVGAGPPQ